MALCELRRSKRLGATSYDSNGRDYLGSKLGWTRSTLEQWLHSPTVRPQLQQFYTSCVADIQRFNDGVEWINAGVKGYFYNETGLEEDLLFMCLCAGEDGQHPGGKCGSIIDFADWESDQSGWLTQELWAGTAWQITQSNRSEDQVFHYAMHDRPAAAWGLVVEMLCIIFHSIAFRGADSVYHPLLKGGKLLLTACDAADDTDEDVRNNTSSHTATTSSSGDVDHSSDATFAERKNIVQAESERSTIILPTDNDQAQVRDSDAEDIGSNIQVAGPKADTSGSSVTTILSTGSSVAQPGQEEPWTPKTSLSVSGTFDVFEVDKRQQVQRWLMST